VFLGVFGFFGCRVYCVVVEYGEEYCGCFGEGVFLFSGGEGCVVG